MRKTPERDLDFELALVNREISTLLRRREKLRQTSPIQAPRDELFHAKLDDYLRLSKLISSKMTRASPNSFREVAKDLREEIVRVLQKYSAINLDQIKQEKRNYLDRVRRKTAAVIEIAKLNKGSLIRLRSKFEFPRQKEEI